MALKVGDLGNIEGSKGLYTNGPYRVIKVSQDGGTFTAETVEQLPPAPHASLPARPKGIVQNQPALFWRPLPAAS